MANNRIILYLCLVALISFCSPLLTKPYPRYSLHNMPQTSFTCRDKILGGYYADSETQCQMFHVCVKVAGVGVQDFRFLCPNATAFDQEAQTCADWGDVDCDQATLYYGSDNFDLYRIGSGFESKKAPTGDDEDTFHLQRAETNDLRGIKSTAVSSLYQNKRYNEPTTQSIAQQSLRNDFTKLNPVSFYQTTPTTTTTTTTRSPPTKVVLKSVNVAAKVEDFSLNGNYQKNSQNFNNADNDNDEIFRASHSSNFFNNRNGKDEGFEDTIVTKATSPHPNRRNRGRKVFNNFESVNRNSTYETTSSTTPSHQRSTFNTINQQRKQFQGPRNEFTRTAQRGDNFRQINNLTPTPRVSAGTTKAAFLPESDKNRNYNENKASNLNSNVNFERFNNHRTTNGQYSNRAGDKSTFSPENISQSNIGQNNHRNEFDNNPRQYNFNPQIGANNQSVNNNFQITQSQPTRPTTYVTVRPVVKSNSEDVDKNNRNDVAIGANFFNGATTPKNDTGKEFSDSFVTKPQDTQTLKQDYFQGNRNNFERFSTQFYDPYFSKQHSSSTQSPTVAIQQQDNQYTSRAPQDVNYNQQSNFNQQNGFYNTKQNYQDFNNKFPLPDIKPTTYNPQQNLPNKSQYVNSTPRGFSLPSSTAKNDIFNEKNFETQFTESQTPSAPKRFSTLVPKNLYPTTFKPTTYKTVPESPPISFPNQFDNQFYSKLSTATYYTNNPTKSPPSSTSTTTTTTSTTTTTKTTTTTPAYGNDNIEDDGQYHPELYEQDLPKNKLKQKKIENNYNGNQFKTTQSDNHFRGNQFQNRHSNPQQHSFNDEDEFLQTAHSQNIAASGNELRSKNAQKAEVKHVTKSSPIIPSRPRPTPSITTKKPILSDKDASYDYAYYDTINEEPSDYSEYGLKEFKKTSTKKY